MIDDDIDDIGPKDAPASDASTTKTRTPAARKAGKAKKTATKAKAPKALDADGEVKTTKTKTPRVPAIVVTTVLHGETRLNATDPEAAEALQAVVPTIDAVHALGRVRITSATHVDGVTTMHLVLPGHPSDHDAIPGLILELHPDGGVHFDHLSMIDPDRSDADLIDAVAHGMLTAMKGDDLKPAGRSGRRADWFDRCVAAVRHLSDDDPKA